MTTRKFKQPIEERILTDDIGTIFVTRLRRGVAKNDETGELSLALRAEDANGRAVTIIIPRQNWTELNAIPVDWSFVK